ncbi:MAG TPA: hypothetical protein VKX28_11320 [Xanthobacteraceae bacterium]|nr:hypothetical protein [Xanthobacteraceae bacterium]
MSSTSRAGCAFAIVLVAIAALLSAPAGGDAAPKADSAVRLTPEQWAKIVKRMDSSGDTRDLPAKVAVQLGLTKGTATFAVHELAFEREGYQHGIYRSVDPKDDRVILAFRTPEKKWTAFLTNTHFKLISAIVWSAGDEPVAWPASESLPAFDNELVYWSVLADLF